VIESIVEGAARSGSLVREIAQAMLQGLTRSCFRSGDSYTIEQMHGMPDYLLRDLGLHRSEIEGVVRGVGPRDRRCTH
jgi:hypothetical protein